MRELGSQGSGTDIILSTPKKGLRQVSVSQRYFHLFLALALALALRAVSRGERIQRSIGLAILHEKFWRAVSFLRTVIRFSFMTRDVMASHLCNEMANRACAALEI